MYICHCFFLFTVLCWMFFFSANLSFFYFCKIYYRLYIAYWYRIYIKDDSYNNAYINPGSTDVLSNLVLLCIHTYRERFKFYKTSCLFIFFSTMHQKRFQIMCGRYKTCRFRCIPYILNDIQGVPCIKSRSIGCIVIFLYYKRFL